MFGRKTDENARILSVQDDTQMNGLGNANTMSGTESPMMTDSLPGTINRYRVRFQLSDGGELDTVITGKKIDRFLVGDHGKLVYRGNVVIRWK